MAMASKPSLTFLLGSRIDSIRYSIGLAEPTAERSGPRFPPAPPRAWQVKQLVALDRKTVSPRAASPLEAISAAKALICCGERFCSWVVTSAEEARRSESSGCG